MTLLRCLYQHPDFVVLHKPADIPFHTEDNTSSSDLNAIDEGMVSQAKNFMKTDDLYPVHRLDRMTSGLMLFARNKASCSQLSQLFQDKQIEKYYLALSAQKPKKKQGAVIGDMAKSRSGNYMLTRGNTNPAITRFFANKLTEDLGGSWLFILKPETGKTHQIRVALKSLGSPILGDKRYSGNSAARGYLHAYKIRFNYQGVSYHISDPTFSGPEFDLSKLLCSKSDIHTTNPFDVHLFNPENLPWPKGTFLINK